LLIISFCSTLLKYSTHNIYVSYILNEIYAFIILKKTLKNESLTLNGLESWYKKYALLNKLAVLGYNILYL